MKEAENKGNEQPRMFGADRSIFVRVPQILNTYPAYLPMPAIDHIDIMKHAPFNIML